MTSTQPSSTMTSNDLFPPVPTCSHLFREQVRDHGDDLFPTCSQTGPDAPEGASDRWEQVSPDRMDQRTGWRPPTPQTAPRLYPAWKALFAHLADGQWHERQETLRIMTQASDIQKKTAANLIAGADKYGLIHRRKYQKRHEDRLTTLGLQKVQP